MHPDITAIRQQVQHEYTAYLEDHYEQMLGILRDRGYYSQHFTLIWSILDGLIEVALQHGVEHIAIGAQCLDVLMRTSGPSHYDYVEMILRNRFPRLYFEMHLAGTLRQQITAVTERCRDVFDANGFDNPGSPFFSLEFAIVETLSGLSEGEQKAKSI